MRDQRFRSLTLVLGTLLAFACGLVGPTVAHDLGARLPSGIGTGLLYGLVALFVIGIVAGAFGRGVVGIVALATGVVLAAVQAQALIPNSVDPEVTAFLVPIAVALGYVVGRAVDPLWSPRSSPPQPHEGLGSGA